MPNSRDRKSLPGSILFYYYYYYYYYYYFLLFRATPKAFGDSQAKGPLRAVVARLYHSHSNVGSEPVCNLHHSSQQHQILNPLSKARDRTCILMDTSRVRYHSATVVTPQGAF